MPRHASTHAAGVVITRRPVVDYVPLAKNDESVVTQYVMTTLEELGLLKMDFLGLRNLTILDDTVRLVQKSRPGFSLADIPDNDPAVFQMLSEGRTSGVFQMESAGMTGVCVGLKPQNIEDITAIIALYRPGPMDSIPRFIACKHNPDKVKYKHPMLEPILSVTYGCIVYQEQVIEIFRRLAGYTLGQADMVRRAMSKKKVKDIERGGRPSSTATPGGPLPAASPTVSRRTWQRTSMMKSMPLPITPSTRPTRWPTPLCATRRPGSSATTPRSIWPPCSPPCWTPARRWLSISPSAGTAASICCPRHQ